MRPIVQEPQVGLSWSPSPSGGDSLEAEAHLELSEGDSPFRYATDGELISLAFSPTAPIPQAYLLCTREANQLAP